MGHASQRQGHGPEIRSALVRTGVRNAGVERVASTRSRAPRAIPRSG